ncbi:chaperone for protein-folding within the ER, fungal-domain-containing protein [Mycena sp. CBHHK59/15]|nr:chaperone for protein-folding within the ER, fungal-domain-containing protein [Mycena sp. CBHHK59/15]
MLATSLITLALAAYTAAQDPFGADHNTTSIVGTWSSGTQHVVPGPGFANPAQELFTYPNATGVGYAFSDDGWYELARYRFVANGSHPDCIIGTVIWAHGHYDLLQNGSIILTPIGDGYQQVQSPCAHVSGSSSFIQNYNETELMLSWRIFTDPNMLPKQKLRNTQVTVVTTTSDGMISTETIVARALVAPPRKREPQEGGWRAIWARMW